MIALGIAGATLRRIGFVGVLAAAVSQATCAAEPGAVGRQPSGGLSGKIVYLHGGHGYTAHNKQGGRWATQRPLLLGMVEDLGNKDQMDLLADYLFRAGATVAPLRPVGRQGQEVVLDNDDSGVEFDGEWSDSEATVYFGDAGDVPYRFAATSPIETAVARYRPSLPAAGRYPVYTWATAGANRAADQLYRIHHSGGATEVTVNHRRVGHGPVYLGTYHFKEGQSACVEISNRSAEGDRVVIADMVRFGNGRGDIDRGGGVSGLAREDEAGLYWVQWHVDRSQGIPDKAYRTLEDDREATISLAPRFSAYMNREADGQLSDRVFVSFHSNASTGKARGVLGLHNGNGRDSARTPYQELLARLLAAEVNRDLVAQRGRFEHDWHDRGEKVTLDRTDIEFGEINNEYILDEFDATIVETGFHDNREDAEMLRDPRVRDAIARATYQGLLKYFAEVDGSAAPEAPLPEAPTAVQAVGSEAGVVTLRWRPPPVGAYAGGPPNGYRVYSSADGHGFDGGFEVAGGDTTTWTVPVVDAGGVRYYAVATTNEGGESKRSAVVACAAAAGPATVLIVDGFTRLDRRLNPTQPYLGGGRVERVWPNVSNGRDSAVRLTSALHAADARLAIDSTAAAAVAEDRIKLSDYDAVFWILGEQSSSDGVLRPDLQALVAEYLASGGRLFISGSDLAWDLDHLGHGREFLRKQIGAEYVANDAGARLAAGVRGTAFGGIEIAFDSPTPLAPDVLREVAPATPAMIYANGAGTAALQRADAETGSKVVVLGLPFEYIVDPGNRIETVRRVIDYFDLPRG